jgi:hypothetical protein
LTIDGHATGVETVGATDLRQVNGIAGDKK